MTSAKEIKSPTEGKGLLVLQISAHSLAHTLYPVLLRNGISRRGVRLPTGRGEPRVDLRLSEVMTANGQSPHTCFLRKGTLNVPIYP